MPFSLVPDCSKRWPRVFKGRILRSETVKSQAIEASLLCMIQNVKFLH